MTFLRFGNLFALSDVAVGRWVFALVFALLAIWIFLIPAERIGQTGPVPLWRNVRFWAVLVALTQVVIYFWWG